MPPINQWISVLGVFLVILPASLIYGDETDSPGACLSNVRQECGDNRHCLKYWESLQGLGVLDLSLDDPELAGMGSIILEIGRRRAEIDSIAQAFSTDKYTDEYREQVRTDYSLESQQIIAVILAAHIERITSKAAAEEEVNADDKGGDRTASQAQGPQRMDLVSHIEIEEEPSDVLEALARDWEALEIPLQTKNLSGDLGNLASQKNILTHLEGERLERFPPIPLKGEDSRRKSRELSQVVAFGGEDLIFVGALLARNQEYFLKSGLPPELYTLPVAVSLYFAIKSETGPFRLIDIWAKSWESDQETLPFTSVGHLMHCHEKSIARITDAGSHTEHIYSSSNPRGGSEARTGGSMSLSRPIKGSTLPKD